MSDPQIVVSIIGGCMLFAPLFAVALSLVGRDKKELRAADRLTRLLNRYLMLHVEHITGKKVFGVIAHLNTTPHRFKVADRRTSWPGHPFKNPTEAVLRLQNADLRTALRLVRNRDVGSVEELFRSSAYNPVLFGLLSSIPGAVDRLHAALAIDGLRHSAHLSIDLPVSFQKAARLAERSSLFPNVFPDVGQPGDVDVFLRLLDPDVQEAYSVIVSDWSGTPLEALDAAETLSRQPALV